ncbi:hypothetical protein QE152_g40477 [Popillia japonica]|uniref:Uncharacterized protein n=1 Tax=Popillia japonica TaxID=7064 RepID=A0AAW1HG38_POPJA
MKKTIISEVTTKNNKIASDNSVSCAVDIQDVQLAVPLIIPFAQYNVPIENLTHDTCNSELEFKKLLKSWN